MFVAKHRLLLHIKDCDAPFLETCNVVYTCRETAMQCKKCTWSTCNYRLQWFPPSNMHNTTLDVCISASLQAGDLRFITMFPFTFTCKCLCPVIRFWLFLNRFLTVKNIPKDRVAHTPLNVKNKNKTQPYLLLMSMMTYLRLLHAWSQLFNT